MSEIIWTIALYSIIGAIIFINRKKFKWIGLVYAYSSKTPLKWMDKLKPKLWVWKIYGTITIVVALFFLPQIIYYLGANAYKIFTTTEKNAGVAIAIPGVKIPGSPIYIPLFYGIISIGVLAFLHEMGHGIIAKSEGIKLKSSGFGMFLIFPLFFVEPDESSFEKSRRISKLRMLSAGSGTNIITFFLIALILNSIFPFFDKYMINDGVVINSIVKGMPADLAGIKNGEIIHKINNYEIKNLTDFLNIIGKFRPGETITITTNKGEYEIKLSKNPENETKPYLGIYLSTHSVFSDAAKEKFGFLLEVIKILYQLFSWIAFLNFSIGIMNLLPVKGLDGARILEELLAYINPKVAKQIVNIVSSICLFLLLVNLMPSIFKIFS